MAVEARYTDEDIRSMVDDGIVDPHVEESLRTMQSEVSTALQERAEFPSIAQLDWVDYIEETAVALAGEMGEDGEDLTHGADVFATRAGEEELVSELRRQAAWCDEWRGQADALAAGARGLRDRYLRTAAGITAGYKDGGELLRAATSEFRQHVAKEMDGGGVPETDAARAEAIEEAARAGQGVGARFTEKFLGLAERLRRRALDYGAGDEALTQAMTRRAAEVEELCADPEALVARMLASSSWRLWKALNSHGAGPQGSITATPPR
ncbi:hypothetical protein D1007_22807 [Hordeum vulgare]|uniref:Uncharacterized protein n=1 Tax=Hordeum vulgare subsp. vulgare TaxID=112509 RepID=A0A8I6WQA9_HORVV|nr:hypothetical protein D1007_22807 [Hordeum vulgare]KAI5007740.1 hypothetical protein ZWY2020_008788 [Hordeum vulgare]